MEWYNETSTLTNCPDSSAGVDSAGRLVDPRPWLMLQDCVERWKAQRRFELNSWMHDREAQVHRYLSSGGHCQLTAASELRLAERRLLLAKLAASEGR